MTQVQDLIGNSAVVHALRADLAAAARCDAKVLVYGESGAGKEVVARLIHAYSARRHHPLVTVNCAALSDTLLETELFGHVRGSFTGAYRDRMGALELGHRGTVFLDEIGEMTPRMQGLLLRFLETGEIQRVGSERLAARADVRVITATNRDLAGAMAENTFREDLYYRLNVLRVRVPPLRERREDVRPLLAEFLTTFADQYRLAVPVLTPGALEALAVYDWPGNVRELRNFAERLVVRALEQAIDVDDLPPEIADNRSEPYLTGATPSPQSGLLDALYARLLDDRQSFWSVVYEPFAAHDLTRDDLRHIVRRGLEETSGNYRMLTELFNMPSSDYKRFLTFLTKHQCRVAFQPFRCAATRPLKASVRLADPAGKHCA